MRLTTLDAFRGIFAVMIVLLHANFQSHLFYFPLVRHGALFVAFFFVLSGFVVTMAYWGRTTNLTTFAGFLVRRIGRLWPLHAFVLTLFIGIVFAKTIAASLGLYNANPDYTGPQIASYALEHLFLVQAFRNETVYWLNFPSWSISAELVSYIVFGVLCLTGRYFAPIAVAILVTTGLAAWSFIDFGFGHFFGEGLFAATFYFLVGHFCYQLWSSRRHTPLKNSSALEVTIVVAIVLQTLYIDQPYVKYLTPLSFAAAVYVFAYESGFISRLLKTAPFAVLGTLSYSIYMLHALVYEIMGLTVSAAEKKLGLALTSPNRQDSGASLIDFGSPYVMDAVVIALVALVIALAKLTQRYVELPGQQVSKRLASRIESGLVKSPVAATTES